MQNHRDTTPSPHSQSSQNTGTSLALSGQAEALALDILTLSRNTLLVHLRFLQPALCRLSFCPDPETTLATDGSFLYYQFLHILKSYRIQKELVMRDYLHTVLHCIFHHPFIDRQVDSCTWDLACDIAVEAIITELDLPETKCSRSLRQAEVLEALKVRLPLLTAEKLYRHFRSQQLPPERLSTIRELFQADDHALWYQLTSSSENDSNADEDDSSGNSRDRDAGDSHAENQDPEQPDSDRPCGDSGQAGPNDESGQNNPQPQSGRQEDKKFWKEISARIQTDLETTSRRWGEKAGSLVRALSLSNRKKLDYSAFLRRFSVLGEEIHINDEEFDYIYYTYGLKLYEKMPLIEPLEYKEVKKIRDFVIAIDTSASVEGELVERFLQRTCEILLQEETFFTKICLHILQCDTVIQSAAQITCRRELDDYLANITLSGFGGTDFRPVFDYIRARQEQGQLLHLKGLLYFTDGDGTYPAAPPPYETAFIFVDRESGKFSVPPWAIRLMIAPDDTCTLFECYS